MARAGRRATAAGARGRGGVEERGARHDDAAEAGPSRVVGGARAPAWDSRAVARLAHLDERALGRVLGVGVVGVGLARRPVEADREVVELGAHSARARARAARVRARAS